MFIYGNLKILFVFALVITGVSLGFILNMFIPCKDYMTPLFVVLAIHIYLTDMSEKNKVK